MVKMFLVSFCRLTMQRYGSFRKREREKTAKTRRGSKTQVLRNFYGSLRKKRGTDNLPIPLV